MLTAQEARDKTLKANLAKTWEQRKKCYKDIETMAEKGHGSLWFVDYTYDPILEKDLVNMGYTLGAFKAEYATPSLIITWRLK
jgi:hypothetical protein